MAPGSFPARTCRALKLRGEAGAKGMDSGPQVLLRLREEPAKGIRKGACRSAEDGLSASDDNETAEREKEEPGNEPLSEILNGSR